jgi:hypothetical protein
MKNRNGVSGRFWEKQRLSNEGANISSDSRIKFDVKNADASALHPADRVLESGSEFQRPNCGNTS